MRVLWETDGYLGDIKIRVRMVQVEDEVVLEVMSPVEEGFWERLKFCFKYLFLRQSITLSIIPVMKEDIEILKDSLGEVLEEIPTFKEGV